MGECVLTRRSVVKNEYELLADITVSSATTNVDITGLNLVKGEEYVLVCDVYNPTATGTPLSILINGNNTVTNYYTQYISANGTSVTSGRENNANLQYHDQSRRLCAIANLKITNNGYFVWQSNANRAYDLGSSSFYVPIYGTSTFTVTSITSIRLLVGVTNAIGVGSRFQLYKTGGI